MKNDEGAIIAAIYIEWLKSPAVAKAVLDLAPTRGGEFSRQMFADLARDAVAAYVELENALVDPE